MSVKLQIITGLSGSGKTIALHTLEDLGYYCIDNLPISLIESLAEYLNGQPEAIFSHTAIGIDARNQSAEIKRLPEIVKRLQASGLHSEIIFLEAQNETLIKRFSETRRKHPLTHDNVSLDEAIRCERKMLKPLMNIADLIVDTTYTNLHELKELLRDRLFGDHPGLSLMFKSFGFKHGVPRDVDFVFDVRCLPNPHWNKDLRPLCGRDQPVADFLEHYEESVQLKQDLIGFLERWIPRFERDGRNYLTVAIGCTGGQHRSVYMVEQLYNHFKTHHYNVLSRHRELP